MVKKGRLEEIFSKAKFSNESFSYKIIYRDFDVLKEVSLPEFIKVSDSFQTIPATRIEYVKKDNEILYKKGEK